MTLTSHATLWPRAESFHLLDSNACSAVGMPWPSTARALPRSAVCKNDCSFVPLSCLRTSHDAAAKRRSRPASVTRFPRATVLCATTTASATENGSSASLIRWSGPRWRPRRFRRSAQGHRHPECLSAATRYESSPCAESSNLAMTAAAAAVLDARVSIRPCVHTVNRPLAARRSG
jgi:hypothetical protein